MKRKELELNDYIEGIQKGDIAILSRAISLVESKKVDHQNLAKELIKNIYPSTGKAKRVGISGTPGVGKSTFIESFGTFLTGIGLKVAVLAIDPTSYKSGGSILGDKTRMNKLASDKNAFVRPSPSGMTLGGVANKTRESMLLCEAAGYDIVIIETVGVGQSEVAVSKVVDFFLLLMQPGGGDDLQGIKRGILELADLVAIN
jgi:LAO/AO transport system kinase